MSLLPTGISPANEHEEKQKPIIQPVPVLPKTVHGNAVNNHEQIDQKIVERHIMTDRRKNALSKARAAKKTKRELLKEASKSVVPSDAKIDELSNKLDAFIRASSKQSNPALAEPNPQVGAADVEPPQPLKARDIEQLGKKGLKSFAPVRF